MTSNQQKVRMRLKPDYDGLPREVISFGCVACFVSYHGVCRFMLLRRRSSRSGMLSAKTPRGTWYCVWLAEQDGMLQSSLPTQSGWR